MKIWRILEIFTRVTEDIFPGLSEPVRGESGSWRLRERGFRPRASAKSSVQQHWLSRISSFGDCDFSAVCTPYVRRAMCGPGDGAQKDPAGVRSTLGGAAEYPSGATSTGNWLSKKS